MPRAVGNRFTIYDKMQADGAFANNPANVHSFGANGEALYQGPVPFPKMLYHPEGVQRQTNPGEALQTPFGPKLVGQQFELIYEIVNDQEAADRLMGEGWHEHPADAIRVRVTKLVESGELPASALEKMIPKKGAESHARDLQKELDSLKKQLAERDEQDAKNAIPGTPVVKAAPPPKGVIVATPPTAPQ